MNPDQMSYAKSLAEKVVLAFVVGFLSSLVASGIDLSHFDKLSILSKALNGAIASVLALLYGLAARLNGTATASLVDKG